MPSFKIIGLLVQEKKIFQGFSWRPSWSCDFDHLYNLSFILPKMLHIKFDFDWPSDYREEDLNIMVIDMYIAPGQGQTTLWAQNISININLLFIC